MKQLRGFFDCKTGILCDNSCDVVKYSDESIEVLIFGRVETEDGINNIPEIVSAFSGKKESFTEKVNGIYICMFYDKINKTMSVFHDRTTSSATFYYAEKDEKVYFSTSLKSVLVDSGIERKLNNNVIEEFITNGFIYGKETLCENIFKLEAFKSLFISNSGIEIKKSEYSVKEMSKGEALNGFNSALENAVKKCIIDKNNVSLPLSGGYDSNYIAHIVSDNNCKNVTAFSIGGKFGKSELPIVESNIKYYNGFGLKTALTKDDTLQNFPDIVWRLEGSVYEVGLFLQYELASLVKNSGKKSLICGECADQVFNKFYFCKDRLFPEKKNEPTYYEFSEYPYIFGSFVILKKNGILANSFGIETFYPFLDNDVLDVAKPLGEINGKDKRVHVANCNERFKKEVLGNMKKVGGSTDCHSLFNSKEEISSFINKIENSDFFRKNEEMIKKHSLSEKEKQTGFLKLKTDIRNIVFDILGIGKKSRDGSRYFTEEMKLREYMCIAYIILFEKLILSGDFDLNNEVLNKSFNEIL